MVAYLIRRIFMALLIVVFVSIGIFLMMHLLPGDPLSIYIGDSDVHSLSEEQMQALRHEFGLDKPLPEQYISWIWGVCHGDFGKSIIYQQPVTKLLLQCYPPTIYIGTLSFLFSALFGIVVGLIAGLKRGKWIDQLTLVLTYLGVSTPGFWLAVLLVYVLGLKLNLLPICGYTSPFTDFGMSMSIRQAVMPVICLSITGVAATARQMRTSIIEVNRMDYIRTAWSKGLNGSTIIRRHALKNSLIPVVTIISLNVRHIFGGSVIVETIFAIPGVGRLMVGSMMAHDAMVVQSIALIVAVSIVFTNLIIDLSYGWLDPRIRHL